MLLSLKSNNGWLRRYSICVAWSSAFLNVNFPSNEIRCETGMWVEENGLYTCSDENEIPCELLTEMNHTCIVSNTPKPIRLANDVDICKNFEENLSPEQSVNLTINYNLMFNPNEIDYLGFYVIDKDKPVNYDESFIYEDVNGNDVAMKDAKFEFFILEKWGDSSGVNG
jgi:hypothetical protein